MASSLTQRGVRGHPPPDQLASFYKLVDKAVTAGVLGRHARHVELASQAAQTAEALFGDDSLIVADLRCSERSSLSNLSSTANGVEKETFLRRSWAVLLSVINLLQLRLAAKTLLPGSVREEELDYEVHAQDVMKKAWNKPVPPPALLRGWASTMGNKTMLTVMYGSLNLLPFPFWPAVQKRMVESFVLQGLDVIPRTAGIQAHQIFCEEDLVAVINEKMTPRNYGSPFCAAVLRKWHSNAVSSVLQARGVLQTGVDKFEQTIAEFEARKHADIANHGLRDCALPSCSKTEKTVKEFSLCAGCRSQVYCCLEHQALDWKAHKKACKEKEAARLAEERADDEGAAA